MLENQGDTVTQAKKSAQAIIDAAKGTFGTKSPSTVYLQIGKDLDTGLANGILAGEAGAVKAMQTVVNVVLAVAKELTKVSSPSAVYAELGMNMMQGLAQGISSGARLPASAMTSAIGGLSPRLGGGGGGGITIGAPIFHITAASGSTPDIKKAIDESFVKFRRELIQSLRAGSVS